MYDIVIVPCPKCGTNEYFQSKSGYCELSLVDLKDCPNDILIDVNRHSPYNCGCGIIFEVDLATKKSVKSNSN